VHNTVTQKYSVFKAGNHRKDSFLFGEGQMCLEPDQVEHGPDLILPPELHNRIILFTGHRMVNSHRLERTETQRIRPSARHHFHRHTAFKNSKRLSGIKIVKLCPEIHFDVVGRVDLQTEALVEALGKENNVELNLGYVSDTQMREAFTGADWIVVPYKSASQSGIIIDAYKYARPVIAFDVGAIAEQVRDEKSGYLVAPGDIDGFAEKLREAMALDQRDYREMCRQAYEYGSEKYSSTGAIQRFLEIF